MAHNVLTGPGATALPASVVVVLERGVQDVRALLLCLRFGSVRFPFAAELWRCGGDCGR